MYPPCRFYLYREWTEYYISSPRSTILNLISLEISDTSLASMVEAPEIVRKVNMINQIWPKDSPFNRFVFCSMQPWLGFFPCCVIFLFSIYSCYSCMIIVSRYSDLLWINTVSWASPTVSRISTLISVDHPFGITWSKARRSSTWFVPPPQISRFMSNGSNLPSRHGLWSAPCWCPLTHKRALTH